VLAWALTHSFLKATFITTHRQIPTPPIYLCNYGAFECFTYLLTYCSAENPASSQRTFRPRTDARVFLAVRRSAALRRLTAAHLTSPVAAAADAAARRMTWLMV